MRWMREKGKMKRSVWKINEGLRELIRSGKTKEYLTYYIIQKPSMLQSPYNSLS